MPRGRSIPALARLAGTAAIVAPATIVLHEGGHWTAGRLLGFPARLGPFGVSGGPTLGASPDWQVVLAAGAGPLVTAVLAAWAWFRLRRGRNSSLAFATALLAPVRMLVGGVYAWSALGAWLAGERYRGHPNFDEYNAASALGANPLPIVLAELALVATLWVWAISGQPRGRRATRTVTVAAAGAAGIATWAYAAGPALLG
jgi:hypothetical protein